MCKGCEQRGKGIVLFSQQEKPSPGPLVNPASVPVARPPGQVPPRAYFREDALSERKGTHENRGSDGATVLSE